MGEKQMSDFSSREEEVIQLLLEGKTNKQIAFDLNVSERTVEYHLHNIYAKLDVSSKVEAALKLGKSTGEAKKADLGKSTVAGMEKTVENESQTKLLWRLLVSKNFKWITALVFLGIVGVSIFLFVKKAPQISAIAEVAAPPMERVTFDSPSGIILYLVPPENDVYLANADGTNKHLILASADAPYDISEAPYIVNAILSPDAKDVIYVADGFLYARNIETGEQVKLNKERMGGEYRFVQWSPDGKKIGFDCIPRITSEICILDTKTGDIDVLTNSQEFGAIGMDGFYFGGWSRDGSKIGLCLSIAPEQTGRSEISFHWLDTSTKEIHFIVAEKTFDDSFMSCPPSISPDGEKLFFNLSSHDKPEKLYTINISGDNLEEISLGNVENEEAFLTKPRIFNADGSAFFASYCATQLYMGVCTPVLVSTNGELLYQLNLSNAVITSWYFE